MEQRSELKSARLLELYTRLEQGAVLKKSDLAYSLSVSPALLQMIERLVSVTAI